MTNQTQTTETRPSTFEIVDTLAKVGFRFEADADGCRLVDTLLKDIVTVQHESAETFLDKVYAKYRYCFK